MGILQDIVRRIKGNACTKLVKRTANEINLTGASFDANDIKFSIGEFSGKVVELVKASDLAVALDDSQYLLCEEINNLKDESILKDECKRIRIQIILGFNQLRAIVGALKESSSRELKKELNDWIKFMSDLHKHGIMLLRQDFYSEYTIRKGESATTLTRIMKYQGINEQELQEAISLL